MTADTRRGYGEPAPDLLPAVPALEQMDRMVEAMALDNLRADAIVSGDPAWQDALRRHGLDGRLVGEEEARRVMDAVARRLAADPRLRRETAQRGIMDRLQRWAEAAALAAGGWRGPFIEGRSGYGDGDVVIKMDCWTPPDAPPDAPGGGPTEEDRMLEGTVE